ncbi:MAG: primosomal protein N' [Parcubacteria group bacterium]|nr:primosomal protein N' [Parcubacteria group bacterium]
MPSIANIIPTTQIPLNKPQYFSYSIPKDLEKDIKPGVEIKIPLGKKEMSGIVFNTTNKAPKFKLKNIIEIIDKIPAISLSQLKLAQWISEYYYTSLGIVIKTMLPKRVQARKHESIKLSKEKTSFPKLTEIQNGVYDSINKSKDKLFLIHGVTGSGKTEIYLKLIKDALDQDKQVVFLVPEISLTPQTVQKIASRFDHNILALLHSNLSAGEKYKAWQNIRDKKTKIIIGPRSAILTPIQDLGLIIIDEEHDQSYKQYDQNPQYQVKDIAFKLSELTDCKVILGSATPSIESYYLAKSKQIKLLEMPERFQGGYAMPKVQIVDMREELKKKNYSIFSEALEEELENTLNNKKQALLFINRRGTSTFVMCRDCGYVIKCPHCDVPLVFHSGFSNSNHLNCHYCNYGEKIKSECPKCDSKYIKYFGAGTERFESEFKALFPSIRVARMDKDTMNTKFAHFTTFNDFLAKKYDVLIGTQMITKGFDLPNIDLIGIISADTCLNLPCVIFQPDRIVWGDLDILLHLLPFS